MHILYFKIESTCLKCMKFIHPSCVHTHTHTRTLFRDSIVCLFAVKERQQRQRHLPAPLHLVYFPTLPMQMSNDVIAEVGIGQFRTMYICEQNTNYQKRTWQRTWETLKCVFKKRVQWICVLCIAYSIICSVHYMLHLHRLILGILGILVIS